MHPWIHRKFYNNSNKHSTEPRRVRHNIVSTAMPSQHNHPPPPTTTPNYRRRLFFDHAVARHILRETVLAVQTKHPFSINRRLCFPITCTASGHCRPAMAIFPCAETGSNRSLPNAPNRSFRWMRGLTLHGANTGNQPFGNGDSGTPAQKRCEMPDLYRLYSCQSGQARMGAAGCGLALFHLPPASCWARCV